MVNRMEREDADREERRSRQLREDAERDERRATALQHHEAAMFQQQQLTMAMVNSLMAVVGSINPAATIAAISPAGAAAGGRPQPRTATTMQHQPQEQQEEDDEQGDN